MYADYDYYRNTYHGKLTEEEYTPLAEFAGAYIDSKTDFLFEKEGMPSEETSLGRRLKTCACALADEKHSIKTGAALSKTSEKVGNFSVTYAAAYAKSDDERLNEVFELYLPDVVKAVRWI